MYKTVRVPMWYDSQFEESFEKALNVYDMTYKQAIAWYYDAAEYLKKKMLRGDDMDDKWHYDVEKYLKERMLEENKEDVVDVNVDVAKIPWRVYNELPGTYFGYNMQKLFKSTLPSELTKKLFPYTKGGNICCTYRCFKISVIQHQEKKFKKTFGKRWQKTKMQASDESV